MGVENIKCCIIAGGTSGRFGSDKSLHVYNGKPVIIPDIIPKLGPIGGIYTAVESIDMERVFVFPCDMPFINTEFIRYMTEIPDYYDIIVPELNGRYQPLHAIYSKNCAEGIKRKIELEDYRMSGFYEGYNIRAVIEDEISFYDDPFKMFKNINFKEDLPGE